LATNPVTPSWRPKKWQGSNWGDGKRPISPESSMAIFLGTGSMMRENRWIRIGYNDITNNIPIYGGIEHFLGGETSVNRKTSSW